MKPNPNPKHGHKRINSTGPIKSMTHNQCHQTCKGELEPRTTRIL